MEWKLRYDRMKKHYGWTNAHVAEMIGNTPASVTEVVRKEPFPRWLKLAILIFEKENGIQDH